MAIKASEGATVIGRGTKFRGELSATDELVIEGVVEGVIHAETTRLTVGREARVKAEIHAQDVIVMGRVEGNIRGLERVELREGAIVLGDVFAKRFSIEEGAAFRGRVDPSKAAEAPAKTQAAGQVAVPAARVQPAPATKPAQSGLFAGASRTPGQMPAGLAAAARNLGSADTPVGLNALSVDERLLPEESV